MKLGDFDIWALSDGAFALDGGQVFGVVPKALWEKKVPADARNRVPMGLNCLLVRTGRQNILIETGIGDKFDAKFADIYGVRRTATLLDGLKSHGLAPEDVEMGGKGIRKRQAVIAVMGAANRDPERFPEPDRLDIERKDNRHVAFGWAAHFCFGAALARMEGQIAFETILRRLPNLALDTSTPLRWRDNLGLRGLTALPVLFGQRQRAMNDGPKRES